MVIKKELSGILVCLDLPKTHPLRATVGQYKDRFEELSDEFLVLFCIVSFTVFLAKFYLLVLF